MALRSLSLLTRPGRWISVAVPSTTQKSFFKRWASTKHDRGDSWLASMLSRSDSKESQSGLLSNTVTIFELQTHVVKPQFMCEYLKEILIATRSFWEAGLARSDFRIQHELTESRHRRNVMLHTRKNEICLTFSFWPDPTPRPDENNIYELRSYALKPGTMIEWGNHWARGLRLRSKQREPVAGLFSHIGELHQVHHLWAYSSLEARQKSRDDTWQDPDWSKCVMHT
ncbi:NIPSNAP family protein, partial [Opisthorchis viverrini]